VSPIKFGILGAADIANRYTADAIMNIKETSLYGVAARDFAKAQKMAEKFKVKAYSSYDDLINDGEIDAIYIPLPIGLHEKWAIKSLEAGKHVWCEKSLAGNFQQVKNIVEMAKKKKLVLVENFMCEHHSQNVFVKNKIKEGEIGKIHNSSFSFGFPPFDEGNLKYNKELDGGALNDAGAYCFDMMTYYLTSSPIAVWSQLSNHNKNVDVAGWANVLFDDGSVSNINFGFVHDYKNESRFWGETGSIVIDRCYSIPPDRKPSVTLTRNTISSLYDIGPCNHFHKQLEHFCDLVKSDQTESEMNKILRQAILMEATRISNREKRIVKLDEFSEWKHCQY
jgi:NDP-hexose-3-ketoreductase